MNNTEWQHKFLKAGTEYGMGDLSMMINIVSEILSEERDKVLDEVKREVENRLEYDLTKCLTEEEICTLLDQLKLK